MAIPSFLKNNGQIPFYNCSLTKKESSLTVMNNFCDFEEKFWQK